MTSLTDFLLERVAEDETVAQSARALQDHGDDRWYVDGPAEKSRKWWVYATGEKFHHEATADHIARHDPARVLAECAARRRVVELHTDCYEECAWKYGETVYDSGPVVTVLPSRPGDGLMVRRSIATRPAIGCPTLLALAAIHSSHPDFDPAWRLP